MKKTCICIGHEPEKLGDANKCDEIKNLIRNEIIKQAENGIEFFYADMSRGVGLWAAQIILDLKSTPEFAHLYLTAILSYPEQTKSLLEKDRLEFDKVLLMCDNIKTIMQKKYNMAFGLKKGFIGQEIDIIIAVCDSRDYPMSTTAQEVRRAQEFKKEVIIINPHNLGDIKPLSDFHYILRTLRKKTEISQIDLSKIIGYDENIIVKYENQMAEPCVDDLIKLARYFEVSVDYLIGNTSISEPVIPIHLKIDYEKLSSKEKNAVKLIISSMVNK